MNRIVYSCNSKFFPNTVYSNLYPSSSSINNLHSTIVSDPLLLPLSSIEVLRQERTPLNQRLQWYDKATNSFLLQQTNMTVQLDKIYKEQEEAHVPIFTRIANEKDSVKLIMESHDHLQKNQQNIRNWLKMKCAEASSDPWDDWEEVMTECNDVSEETYQEYMVVQDCLLKVINIVVHLITELLLLNKPLVLISLFKPNEFASWSDW